ncbi:MAG: sodium:solute symporter family protein [Bdellovibrionales bacterium]|nr:sodium:solute symporter family protein [Bdellovibrionales bacterium]
MNQQHLPAELGWALIFLMSVLWIYLGHYWGQKNKSFDDIAVGSRKIGLALGTATAVASWITSNTTMLAPQFALQMGIWGMLAYCAASFGLFLFAPMAERIRNLMPNGYTSGDFIRLRYGRPTWIIFLCLSLFYSITWLVSMSMAGGILLESLSGIPYHYGMSIILLVCVIYTMRGGIYAVIGTDFIQSTIILLGVIILGIAILNKIDVADIHANLKERSPLLLDMLFPAPIMAIFNNLLFGLGEIFHNNIWWSRAFALRKEVGKKAYFLAGLIWLPVPIAAGFIALTTGVLNINVPAPDMVGPLVAANVLGKSGAIVIFIVVFCSLASSIDSLLAATSDLLTEDVFRKIFRPTATDKQLRSSAQKITLSLGLLVWLLCLPRIGSLATVLFFAGPMVGSMIWPIVSGLYWERANAKGAITGMILGTLIGLATYFLVGWYVASLVSTVVSMVCVFLFTSIQKKRFDWSQLEEVH